MSPFKYSSHKPQNGAVMVEFAIIVPFMLLLVLGIIEFGYGFYNLNILTKSVQDGARYFSDPLRARKGVIEGAIDVTTVNSAITATECLVVFGNTSGSGSALMPTTGSCSGSASNPITVGKYTVTIDSPIADHIRVTAVYQHQLILGNALNAFTGGTVSSTFNLTSSATLRVDK